MTGWPVEPVAATWVTSTQTPGPAEPELEEGVDPDSVTPGVLGFVVTLAAVLACIPLFLSMTRKIRGVQYRGRLQEAADAGAPGAGGGPTGPGSPAHPDDVADGPGRDGTGPDDAAPDGRGDGPRP